jgi:hypothetical protein
MPTTWTLAIDWDRTNNFTNETARVISGRTLLGLVLTHLESHFKRRIISSTSAPPCLLTTRRVCRKKEWVQAGYTKALVQRSLTRTLPILIGSAPGFSVN